MSRDRSNEFLVMFNIHNFPSQNQYLPIIYSNHPMVLLMQNVSVQVAAFLHTSVDFFFVASKYLIFTWWSISNSRKTAVFSSYQLCTAQKCKLCQFTHDLN